MVVRHSDGVLDPGRCLAGQLAQLLFTTARGFIEGMQGLGGVASREETRDVDV